MNMDGICVETKDDKKTRDYARVFVENMDDGSRFALFSVIR
jgi:hypothetical protein